MNWPSDVRSIVRETVSFLLLALMMSYFCFQYSFAVGWCHSQPLMAQHTFVYAFLIFAVLFSVLWARNAGITALSVVLLALCVLSGSLSFLCESQIYYTVFNATSTTALVFFVLWLELIVFFTAKLVLFAVTERPKPK